MRPVHTPTNSKQVGVTVAVTKVIVPVGSVTILKNDVMVNFNLHT